MYNIIANKLTELFLNKSKNSDNYNYNIVVYGMELVISSLVNLVIVLLIGSYISDIIFAIFFAFFFCSVRQFAGGFHADTYVKCTLYFMILYVAFNLLFFRILNFYVCCVLLMICFVFIWFVSPIDTANKRIGADKKKKLRCKVRIILSFELIIAVLLNQVLKDGFIKIMGTALCLESVLLIAGLCQNRFERGTNDKNSSM